ncbi:hypothetical protein Y032_0633g888 [Ancylostoma ceylanicum]|uniref:Uncharacterized protein n=1 Tax=Ancylostoma ceylanicum TaxID=53326 RepID=A0A016WJL0_9BILA|nr:hypothetical protein Y032_0633g888 [Ancylostoma ceylanicum]
MVCTFANKEYRVSAADPFVKSYVHGMIVLCPNSQAWSMFPKTAQVRVVSQDLLAKYISEAKFKLNWANSTHAT